MLLFNSIKTSEKISFGENMSKKSIIQHDRLMRFLFEDFSIRGEFVTINKIYQAILENHNYPEPVKQLLGELLVVTCLLTATLKFEGNITVQLHGDGPLSLAVINGNNHQQMRGIARIKEDINSESTLKEMIGNGYMIITIAPNKGKHYQNIVVLEKETLSECIEDYFRRSEQLPTRLFIRVKKDNKNPLAAGILLQILPSDDRHINGLEHLAILTETVKTEELLELSTEEMLHRLYHQETVRLFDEKSITFRCGCSHERCAVSLMTLSKDEIKTILNENGHIDLLCDYCGKHYIFDQIDITNLQQNIYQTNNTIH